jgi:hypothetical protein
VRNRLGMTTIVLLAIGLASAAGAVALVKDSLPVD